MSWQSLLGACTFLAIAWLLSEHRRRVNFRLVASGVLLTFVTAWVLVKLPTGVRDRNHRRLSGRRFHRALRRRPIGWP